MNRLARIILSFAVVVVLWGCPSSEPNQPWVPPADTKEIGTEITIGPQPLDIQINADASNEQQCEQIWEMYQLVVTDAGQCDSTLDCSHQVENVMQCSCAQWITGNEAEGQLAELAGKYKELNCLGEVACGPCPFMVLPQCIYGQCAAVSPECEDLDSFYSQVLAEARQCQTTADCSAETHSSFECQCPYPISGDVWDGWFGLARQLWDFQGCPIPAPCECAEGEAVCVDNMCSISGEIPNGSTACTGGSQCQPISGCNCGCWSTPPQDDQPDVCPCAAPESCVCHDGNCAQPQEGLKNCATDADCIPVGNCDCGCWSKLPVSENSPEGPQCDCATPTGCLCTDGTCLEVW